MEVLKSLPVAIIGGGPVGLAAAVYLTIRNQPFILFEARNSVGTNVLPWKNIRVFSPWRYNIDKAARQLLSETNWIAPDYEGLPTREELYHEYFKPLSELESIKPDLHIRAKVISIGRKKFEGRIGMQDHFERT